MSKILVAYIPVIHQGYLNFLQKYTDASALYLVGEELLAEFDQMRKDIRRLQSEQVRTVLTVLKLPIDIKVLTPTNIRELGVEAELVMPDEDIMRSLAEKYFANRQITFDTVFLRWDKNNSLKEQPVVADETITVSEFERQIMAQAEKISQKSADWWRQVGAVLVKDGQVLFSTYNHHVPDEQQPYYDGDPRGNFHKGEHLEKATAFHAEADLIAQAAKDGVSLKGADLFVTTFPCPSCAKLIAHSGIEKLYFGEGYAMVDGESILKANGVKIIRVKTIDY